MIILHNQHDKDSRDFVNKYGEGHIVLEYPECLNYYSNISAFPSVVVTLPYKEIDEYIIPELINEETGEIATNILVEKQIFEEHEELIRCPVTWDDVEKFIQDYIEYDPGKNYR